MAKERDDWLARLYYPEGTITLRREGPEAWVWRADVEDNPALDEKAVLATRLSSPPEYLYSPSDGFPGGKIGALLKTRLKAMRVEFPPQPDSSPDTVY